MKFFSRFFLAGSALAIGVVAACVTDQSGVVAVPSDGGPNASSDGSVTKPGDSGSKTPSDGGAPIVDSGPKHYCQTQSAPDGAADFFCADFDESVLSNGFNDASIDEAGSFAATTTAFSNPSALLASVANSDGVSGDGAQYIWSQAGASQLSTLTLTFEANPFLVDTTGNLQHFPGVIVLASAATHDVEIDFGYAAGHVFGAAGAYTGYYVIISHHAMVPGQQTYFLDTLTPNLWTQVSFTYDLINGTIRLTYNGDGNASGYDGGVEISSPTYASTDTVAFVAVGVASEQDSTLGFQFRFDNVRGSTTRSP